MKQKKVLILTDHTNHSSENSLYDLSVKMLSNPNTKCVDIASRAIVENQHFFSGKKDAKLFATSITMDFSFDKTHHPLEKGIKEVAVQDYDLVWLRMPPPLSKAFLQFANNTFSNAVIINNPKSIFLTGSKAFLVNFEHVCPPIKICNTFEDILSFKQKFPIVLKPFREYGGKGIVRIDGTDVFLGNEKISFETFQSTYEKAPIPYLAVKYLKNVSQGDKRIIVVNGEILGASLRLPAKGSWLCNVAMGGSSNITDVTKEEAAIIQTINPKLTKLGIVMYGVDTLVGDDGKRVLSEINTTSIGGLPQIAALKKQPLVEKAIELIWEYYHKKKEN